MLMILAPDAIDGLPRGVPKPRKVRAARAKVVPFVIMYPEVLEAKHQYRGKRYRQYERNQDVHEL